MKILITGADGFIGLNLCQHLSEREDIEVICFTRAESIHTLEEKLDGVECVIHLAGVNRPQDPSDFDIGNHGFTQALVQAIRSKCLAGADPIRVLFASSIQAELENLYGASKRAAESALIVAQSDGALTAHIFRFPNVFGKWCRPNYNSVVATFCYNITRDLPIMITDRTSALCLVYIDDVIAALVAVIDGSAPETSSDGIAIVQPIYKTTVGEVADMLNSFRGSRESLITEEVGIGLKRALYSTYVSYLPCDSFSYNLPMHVDARGTFVEMLKTKESGQFSYFTAHPGVTRGGHYHHSKTEKFLVIKGTALFKFRQMTTGEEYVLETSGHIAEILETVPGWAHDITNIGEDDLIVMLWANEIFDRERPDTYVCPL
jgi:UDP-2-acetamido-2,6-beta-L-arabino-hexul-4-ose reductase